MLTIAKLFGKSPFAPLRSHMKKVASCMDMLEKMFEHLCHAEEDQARVMQMSQELCDLEYEADITKNDIRNHLPKGVFLAIDRSQFLELLALQDNIADQAEEIGLLLTLHKAPLDGVKPELHAFVQKALTVFREVDRITGEIEELLESSFGGLEAEKVRAMVEHAAHREHEAQRLKQVLLHKIFAQGEKLTPPAFYLLVRLTEAIALLAELSEKLANRIRMLLEVR